MDNLAALDGALREALEDGYVLQETSHHLRGCGCRLVNLSIEGMTRSGFEAVKELLVKTVTGAFPFNVLYLNFFPGTGRITRVSFRRFCADCAENHALEKKVGVFTEEIAL